MMRELSAATRFTMLAAILALGGCGDGHRRAAVAPTQTGPCLVGSTGAIWTSVGDRQSGAEYAASAASAGDVNGDGLADVIVGAPGFDTTFTGTGKVYVYHGRPSGLSAQPDWTSSGDDMAQARFGSAIASAGDIDGDGYDDVIVGAPRFDTTNSSAGKAYIYRGGPAGLSTTPFWASSGDDGLDEAFGSSVACAGDVNGDGFPDLIVGAPGAWSLRLDFEGKSYVFLGEPGGLSATPAWRSSGDAQTLAKFGDAVSSAGDVDGDGYSDVVIGAPKFSTTQTDAGRAYLYSGGPGGLSQNATWTSSGDDEYVRGFGSSIASAGDVDGDGFSDVIIGCRVAIGGAYDGGKAFVYAGGINGLSSSPAWKSAGDNITYAEFGYSVDSAGDVNGDGFSDVVVGAPTPWAFSPGQYLGLAYVYLGGPGGLSSGYDWTSTGDSVPNDKFVYVVASAGDADGDGRDDVIVGTPFRSPEGGKAHVFSLCSP